MHEIMLSKSIFIYVNRPTIHYTIELNATKNLFISDHVTMIHITYDYNIKLQI